MFKISWGPLDCRDLFMIKARHDPIDQSMFPSMEVGKISAGLEEGFILPTRSIRSYKEIGKKESKIDGPVG